MKHCEVKFQNIYYPKEINTINETIKMKTEYHLDHYHQTGEEEPAAKDEPEVGDYDIAWMFYIQNYLNIFW